MDNKNRILRLFSSGNTKYNGSSISPVLSSLEIALAPLNYKHLYYFWTVAREGSIRQASDVLHLTPQTISGQLGLLEESVGPKLLAKTGRNLTLTRSGRRAARQFPGLTRANTAVITVQRDDAA